MTKYRVVNLALGVGLASVMAVLPVFGGMVVWSMIVNWWLEDYVAKGNELRAGISEVDLFWPLYQHWMELGWEWLKEWPKGIAWFITGGALWLAYVGCKWGYKRCQWD